MEKPEKRHETIGAGSKKFHSADVHAGRQLRALRVMRGASQKSLGEKIDISFQQIQKYEQGSNRLSVSMLSKICKALEVKPSYFFKEGRYKTAPLPALGDKAIKCALLFQEIPDKQAREALFKAFADIARLLTLKP